MKINFLSVLFLPIIATINVLPLPFAMLSIKPVVAQNKIKLKTFKLPNEFSVSYPAGWFIEQTSNPLGTIPRKLVIISSQKPPEVGGGNLPPNLIKTDILINPGSLEANFKQAIQDIKEDDGKVTSSSKTVVGGKDAFRIWTSGTEGKSILTLVRYGKEETVIIISFYSDNNTSAIPIIERVHGSFRRDR